jgi:hypothetical protein
VEDMAATRVGRKQSNKQRSLEEMPVVPSAYDAGDEEVIHVPSEQVMPVECSSDEQIRHGPSEQVHSVKCSSDEEIRNVPSEQAKQIMCSSDEQAEQIMCSSDEQARHELIEKAQPVMCSEDDQMCDENDKMMDENCDTILVERDVQAVNSESTQNEFFEESGEEITFWQCNRQTFFQVQKEER